MVRPISRDVAGLNIELTEEQKRQINWRSRESFAFAREVHLPFGEIDGVLDWCKHELRDTWRWQLIEASSDIQPGRYIFYFDGEKDCCAFTLKWKVDQ